MRQLLRRIQYLIHRDRQEGDLADELRFHREMKEQEMRRDGASAGDARTSAQRELGNDLSARQQSRDVWVAPWLQDITQDVRFGVRMLLKDRRFTLAAITALALGIAVNNSVFTIVNAALLRELPFAESDRLFDLRLMDRGGLDGVDYDAFARWEHATRSFEGLSASTAGTMNVSDAARPATRLRGTYISSNAFRLLRVEPVLGRNFVPDDERAGAAAVVILGYDVWQSRYGGDPAVVGRALRINETPATVIGVMPQGFAFPMTARLWVPLTQAPGLTTTDRRRRNLSVFGRLAANADLPQVRSEMDTIARQSTGDNPPPGEQRIVVQGLKQAYIGFARGFMTILMTAVAFVLMIACANVASLLLARSAQRSREIAIRTSLGATRWRIARQILIECAAIAVVAGVVGLVLSRFGAAAMSVAFDTREFGAPDEVSRPYWVDLSMNTTAWMFLGLSCLIATLGIGLLPSWHLARTDVNATLKDGGRTSGAVRARRWTNALLVGQLALTVILLTGAVLSIRSFFALYLKDLVIDTSNVVTMRVELPLQKYGSIEQRQQFNRDLDQRVSTDRLFVSTTLASDIPLQPLAAGGRMLAIEGRTLPTGDRPSPTSFVNVGPRYFETIGLPIVRGRALHEEDGVIGREGAIVNQRFATKYFPGEDALGHRIQLSGATLGPAQAPWMTIVGIVPTLPNFFPDRMDDPVVYVPMNAERAPLRVVSIIVRAAGPPSPGIKAAAASALREKVAAVDPDLPLFAIQTLDEAVARGRYVSQVTGSWFLTLAAISLLLASVGLYALTAHGVAQRVQEIGVRMALGAERRQVVWLFVRRTAIQLAIGLTLGLAGAIALSQAMQSMLRETSARDPITLAVVSAVLIVVALGASVLPARRAARVDPAIALRTE